MVIHSTNYYKMFFKIIILIEFFIQSFFQYTKKYFLNENYEEFHIKLKNKTNHEYKNIKFAIIRRTNCPTCGLFSFYVVHLGCINEYLNKGYIPIIDLKSFRNVYNCYNESKNNPWEFFFVQPYGFTLEEVLNSSEQISYFSCSGENRPNEINIYYNKALIDFWHYFAKKYMPIKNTIMEESLNIMKKLFKNSHNVLGVKLRGTDYIYMRPGGHPIPPSLERVISDVKSLSKKYNYDWIFVSSEDEKIKEKFIEQFKNNIKYLNPKTKIHFNYTSHEMITLNKDLICNYEYAKNYLINIIILSKCIDLVSSRGSGTAGIFVLTKGFRNSIIYNLGEY